MFSNQCLQPGLHGYLIHFAPLAFIHHRQNCSRNVPSPLLVHLRLKHFTVTSNVLVTSPDLKPVSISCTLYGWAIKFHKKLNWQATDVLDLINVATTWAAGITAAAGTSLAQPLFLYFFEVEKSYFLKSSTPDSFFILADIEKFSRLLHSIELGLVSQSPSQGTPVKGPYWSLACWVITSTTT